MLYFNTNVGATLMSENYTLWPCRGSRSRGPSPPGLALLIERKRCRELLQEGHTRTLRVTFRTAAARGPSWAMSFTFDAIKKAVDEA